DRHFGLVHLSDQESGEGISAGLIERVLGGLRVERPLAARELVAYLIVLIVANLPPKAEAVLAPNQGGVVDELRGVVLILVRPLCIVAEAAVVHQADVGEAPLYGWSALESGDADFVDHIAHKCQRTADGIVESRVAEPRLGDHAG